MIRFENLNDTVLKNFNGGEGELVAKMQVDGLNKILKGRLKKGSSVGQHTHETSSEIILILSGEGVSVIDGKEEVVKAGDCIYCKKGSSHSLKNEKDEELVFFAVVPNQ